MGSLRWILSYSNVFTTHYLTWLSVGLFTRKVLSISGSLILCYAMQHSHITITYKGYYYSIYNINDCLICDDMIFIGKSLFKSRTVLMKRNNESIIKEIEDQN
jgi:hypothetical protein